MQKKSSQCQYNYNFEPEGKILDTEICLITIIKMSKLYQQFWFVSEVVKVYTWGVMAQISRSYQLLLVSDIR